MILSWVPLPAHAAQARALSQDSDGFQTISNADELYAFAAMVNSGQTAINGRLTADIDLGDRAVMIGTVDYNYSGTFDGNGYSLTVNLNTAEWYVAPFQFVNGAIIKNLTVGGTITTSTKFAGGLVAHFQGTGELTVTNIPG